MLTVQLVVFIVALAEFLDPVLKAYYWVVTGTTVSIGTILLVRCAWRMERKAGELVEGLKRRAG